VVPPPDNKGGSRENESSSKVMNLWDEKGQGHSLQQQNSLVATRSGNDYGSKGKILSYLLTIRLSSKVVYLCNQDRYDTENIGSITGISQGEIREPRHRKNIE